MKDKKLSWEQALRFGRDTILRDPVRTFVLFLPFSLAILANIWFSSNNGTFATAARISLDAVLSIITVAAFTGAMKLCLVTLDGKAPELQEYLMPLRTIMNTCIATILIALIFIVSALPLCAGMNWVLAFFLPPLPLTARPELVMLAGIPSIYLSNKIGFAPWLTVDKRCGPILALKVSARLAHGALPALFVLWLVLLIPQEILLHCSHLGGPLCRILLIPMYVFSFLVNAHAYRQCLQRTDLNVRQGVVRDFAQRLQ